jgi:predicted aspartyl protease
MRRLFGALLATASCWAWTFAQSPSTDPDHLYRTRQWFELRSALTRTSPALMRGAVATAFNDPTAGGLLKDIVRSQPRSDAANAARVMLSQIYARTGQYRRLLQNIDEWASASPNSPELREAKEDMEMFRGRPDQSSGSKRRAMLRHGTDSFTIPVSINGTTDDFLFDTGAAHSAMTELEAKKFGLVIQRESKVLTDGNGGTANFRTAIAPEVAVGAVRLRNVSFAVLEATGPLRDVEAGIAGIPILLAIGSIRWSKDGSVEIGGAPSHNISPNLVFDRHRLLLRSSVLGREILTTFDTGASSTELNTNFATQFADVVERTGKKTTQDSTGVAGTRTFDAIVLPEVIFHIAATDVRLAPASLLLHRIAAGGGECCLGNAGHDLLTQGQGFSIDFSTMTLQLE